MGVIGGLEVARDEYKQLLDQQECQRWVLNFFGIFVRFFRKNHLQRINDHVMNVINRTDGFKSFRK